MGQERDVQSTPRHSGHRRGIVDQCKPCFAPQRVIASPTIQAASIEDSFAGQKAHGSEKCRLPYSALVSTEFCPAKSVCESDVAGGGNCWSAVIDGAEDWMTG